MKISTPACLLLSCAFIFSPCYGIQTPERDSWSVQNCASFAPYRRDKNAYVKMPAIGFSLFLRRVKDVRSRKVTDVDYVHYLFSYGPTAERYVMQGWFGPYAANKSLRETLVRRSASFTESWARIGEDKVLDGQGQTSDGKHWRYLDLGSSALYYEDVSREAANVFDSLLANMCYEPWRL